MFYSGYPHQDEDNLAQLKDAIDVLDIGNDAIEKGQTEAWMIVSAYLYQLLSDKTRGAPLAERVLPNLQLHPLQVDHANNTNPGLSTMPTTSFTEHGMKVYLFELKRRKIPREAWLKQVVFLNQGRGFSLQDYIKLPRDQAGGVHFDKILSPETQQLVQSGVYIGFGKTIPSFRFDLAAIGSYVYSELKGQVMGHIANILREQKLYEKAEGFMNESLAIKRAAGDVEGQVEQLDSLILLYRETARQKEAASLVAQREAMQKTLILS